MESYPIWIRLHPVSVDDTLVTSVQARLHDPLWLLGRQWQMGELRHDAGATPVEVRVEGTAAPLSRLRAGTRLDGDAPVVALDQTGAPLEALVEREPVAEEGLDGLRLRAEAGLHLQRLLRAAGLTAQAHAWALRCPFALPADLDEELLAFQDLVDGRVPDGAPLRARLAAILEGSDTLVELAPGEEAVLRDWIAWHVARFSTPSAGPSTWDPERLEYAFSVAAVRASGEAALAAPEYVEGRLDWYAFEEVRGGLGARGEATRRRHHRIPAPLDFAGMPNPRFWTFEDPSVRFDALDILARPQAKPSPAALMVLDFALSYGDDWFLVPLALDAWTVFEAGEVVVTDVFGDRTPAHPPEGRWNLFRLDAGSGLSSLFVHAPPAEALDGPPVEEVHLLRDEVANVGWAVERRVPHPLGGSREPREGIEPGAGASGLVWTLAPPSPPRNWFPLLPTEIGRLTLGVVWSARDARPAGRMLDELRAPSRRLHQEELPLSGVQVTRGWQSARGSDGSLHLWIGRAKSPRLVETAPAVRFDRVAWR